MTTFLEFRKNKINIDRIDEQLLPKEENSADKMVESGHGYYRNLLLNKNPKAKQAFSENTTEKNNSIRVPISLENNSAEPHKKVTSFLRDNNYTVTPEKYKQGLASVTTQVGNPSKGIPMRDKVVEHKIGGLLEKHNAPSEIKNNYSNDPYRTGSKTSDYDVILSGHPHDVYGGSTGRGWTSCAQMRKGESGFDGSASKHMKAEINNHTHHAYLVPRGGNVDTDAIGRMSFKHHTGISSGHETLLPENRVYGSTPNGFAHAAKKVVSDLFDKKDEIYKKNDSVYNDSGKSFEFPSQVTPEHLDSAWKTLGKKDESEKHQLYAHVNPDEKYKSRELNDVAKHVKGIKNANDTGDFPKVMQSVKDADYGISEKAHYRMLVGENTRLSDVLDAGVKTFDIKNPEHIQTLADSSRYGNHIKSVFNQRIASNIGDAKTADEYHTINLLKNSGINIGERQKTNISDKHEMGRYPHDTIVNSLSEKGMLDQDSYQHSYMSTLKHSRRSGNLYDNAVQHENAGVSGMSKVVDNLAKKLKNNSRSSTFGRHTSDENLAESFHHMKPATRTRFASAMGINHVKLMRNNPAAINAHKEFTKRIKEAQLKNDLQNPEE